MTPLTYEWLKANGFVVLDRLERQPTDHVQRGIATECIGLRLMAAAEDLCLNLTPAGGLDGYWHCWITRAHAFHRNPHVWIGARFVRYVEEVIAMYEGLTGRRFSPGGWDPKKLGEPLFPDYTPNR